MGRPFGSVFHPWDGILLGIDSTFQEDDSKGSGLVYTAPGEFGQPLTVYFCLNVWFWTGEVTRTFEVGMDDLNLMNPTTMEEKASHSLIPHYSNPFYSVTSIVFPLNKKFNVQSELYNTKRKWVSPFGDQEYPRGNDRVQWDGANAQHQDVSAGVDFCTDTERK